MHDIPISDYKTGTLGLRKNTFTMRLNRSLYLLLLVVLLAFSQSFAQSGPGDGGFTPENSPEMKPITNHGTPAYRAAKLFLRGANLGDYLEANRHYRKIQVSADEFAQMKKE